MTREQSALKRYAWTRLEVSQGTKFREQMLVLTVFLKKIFFVFIFTSNYFYCRIFLFKYNFNFLLLNILRFKGVNLSSKLYIVAFEMLVHVLSN